MHDEVVTANSFTTLELVSNMEIDQTLKLPIKELGTYPIDYDE